jgi:hypothetical protein
MRMPRVFLVVAVVLCLGALMFSCSKDETQQSPSPLANDTPLLARVEGPAMAAGGNLSGAIFTTTPDGGIVNENTHYKSKLEVYLDGGPGNNAPQHAAGLPDGMYVFQITDPPGKVLLSEDPSKCRIVEIADDIIVRLVPPSELGMSCDYTIGKGGNAVTYPCHIQDDPDGAAGASGRHDTNTDIDHGADGAIVVQMMPFLDTPNPGGVYKAWLTPLDAYTSMGGDLEALPSPKKVKGKVVGFEADPGFGPPRNMVKTDNFKVKEQPPRICVIKYEDLNGNGVQDPGEPEITGWKIYITETLHDGTTVTNEVYTPVCRSIEHGTTVRIEEELPAGWGLSYVLLDGVPVSSPSTVIDVSFGPTQMEREVTFGNYEYIPKRGHKWHDGNMNGVKDADEDHLPGWTIRLDGTDGMGNSVALETTTDSQGKYEFIVAPGTYTVREVCEPGWYQSYPTPTDGCGSGVYDVVFLSGEVHEGNDFGNYKPVKVKAKKFNDCNADGNQDPGEYYLEDWEFCLKDAAGNLVSADDFIGTPQAACKLTNSDGVVVWTGLVPGDYTVVETPQDGWYPSTPTSKTFDLGSGENGSALFGNYELVQVTITKFHDLNANGVSDADEPLVEGFEFCLRDAAGNLVSADDFIGPADPACQVTDYGGVVVWDNLKPARYKVVETPKPNWEPTTPTEQAADFTDCSADRHQYIEFGNILLLCRVTGGQVDESGNCSACPEGSSGPNRYTCGGQAGASTALQPQPSGEWTHSNKKGPAGRFTFHAGTASAPDGTEIDWIGCGDPPNCFPARPAPAKQIDFGGVGTFKNMSGNVPNSISQWVSVGSSQHYFEVNIDDLGEPGKSGWTDPPTSLCPADGFGLHGSQPLGVCECPDFYRIRIYATSSPSSEIIYEAEGYIAGGNFQIHPLTGHDTH